MSSDRFRRAALALPGAIEGSHQGHADFRVGKRIFATLGYPDEDWGMVKLTSGAGRMGQARQHQCAAGQGRRHDVEKRTRHGLEECRAESDRKIRQENVALISHCINRPAAIALII